MKTAPYAGILAPPQAPDWASDRETVWNQHQNAQLKRNGELRDDAQLAREVTIALPQELTREQNIELAKAYARVFVEQGMVVDVSVHDKGDGNPHAHYLLTMREISEDGFSKKKNGHWDRNEYVIGWRKAYQDITNQYLEMNGFEERICVDSYEKQGVDRIPTVHLGCAAHHMEQSGIATDRGNINRSIQEANREIEGINREIEILKKEMENIRSVDDRIAHYRQASEAVRTATAALRHRLTEAGERSFVQQLRGLQEALQRLQPSSPELGRPSAPDSPLHRRGLLRWRLTGRPLSGSRPRRGRRSPSLLRPLPLLLNRSSPLVARSPFTAGLSENRRWKPPGRLSRSFSDSGNTLWSTSRGIPGKRPGAGALHTPLPPGTAGRGLWPSNAGLPGSGRDRSS